MHVLKIIFESEGTGKRWVLSRMSDVSYVNGVNIHSIVKTKQFSIHGITDFRAETTMFPKNKYTIDDDISTELWSFLTNKKGFNEVVKDAIGIMSYVKEIFKGIKTSLSNVYTFYTKKRIKALLLTSVATMLIYYIMSYLCPSIVIYSVVPISLHIAVYFLVTLVIMIRNIHKKITYNIYKGRIYNE